MRTVNISAYLHSPYLQYRVLLCAAVSFCLHYCHAPRFYFIVVVNASAKIAGTSGPSEPERGLGGQVPLPPRFWHYQKQSIFLQKGQNTPAPRFSDLLPALHVYVHFYLRPSPARYDTQRKTTFGGTIVTDIRAIMIKFAIRFLDLVQNIEIPDSTII